MLNHCEELSLLSSTALNAHTNQGTFSEQKVGPSFPSRACLFK